MNAVKKSGFGKVWSGKVWSGREISLAGMMECIQICLKSKCPIGIGSSNLPARKIYFVRNTCYTPDNLIMVWLGTVRCGAVG